MNDAMRYWREGGKALEPPVDLTGIFKDDERERDAKRKLFNEYKAFYEREMWAPEPPFEKRNIPQEVLDRYNAYWMRIVKEDRATQWLFGMVGWTRDAPHLEIDLGFSDVPEKVAVLREFGVGELWYRGPSDAVCELIEAGCSVKGVAKGRGDMTYLVIEVPRDGL